MYKKTNKQIKTRAFPRQHPFVTPLPDDPPSIVSNPWILKTIVLSAAIPLSGTKTSVTVAQVFAALAATLGLGPQTFSLKIMNCKVWCRSSSSFTAFFFHPQNPTPVLTCSDVGASSLVSKVAINYGSFLSEVPFLSNSTSTILGLLGTSDQQFVVHISVNFQRALLPPTSFLSDHTEQLDATSSTEED